ncbi:hypothetical protein N7451_002775 [Penicillium sp. IBT 35674x]|nr:hypothetical protein N7451_002775 [Penicillium sp. IBT 35674x]
MCCLGIWKVKETFGIPCVVVYKSTYIQLLNSSQSPLSVPIVFENDLKLNVNSVYASLREIVNGFSELPPSIRKTFILTGNAFNTTAFNASAFPSLLTLGVEKTAGAHSIAYAAKSYAISGYKYHSADRRDEDGSPT